MFFKFKYKLLIFGIFLLLFSFSIASCVTLPSYEWKTLDLSYVVEDPNLKYPPSHVTRSFPGFHNYEKETLVMMTENKDSGYGVSSWVINELGTDVFYEVHNSFHRLRLDYNFQVTAKLHCLIDDVCKSGFVCEFNVCTPEH